MNPISFADVVHQVVTFDADDPAEQLVLQLIDCPWLQRLREITQTADLRSVYMFAEHSRFGHSVGVTYLAKMVLQTLKRQFPAEVDQYRKAILAAALLHDIGHLAPGSHVAMRIWFPEASDHHESVAIRIIRNDPTISKILESAEPGLTDLVCQILAESPPPPWSWQIISGGGWNADRGNWCVVDSVMAGVSYGRYNIHALTDALTLTRQRELAIKESRVDAMMHFMISRQAMYSQVYHHRVLIAADHLEYSVIQRARDLGVNSAVFPADKIMQELLSAPNADQLSLNTINGCRESWYRYHLMLWRDCADPILCDLADRIINRRLFKTIRARSIAEGQELYLRCKESCQALGFDSRYYLHKINAPRSAELIRSDILSSMPVVTDCGQELSLADTDSFAAMVAKSSNQPEELLGNHKVWLAVPKEVKEFALGSGSV